MHARDWGFRMGSAVLVAFLVSGCDDATMADPTPAVETMLLAVELQVIQIAGDGTVVGGPLVLSGEGAVNAWFFDTSGEPDDAVTSESYELSIQLTDTELASFTPAEAFAGTLTALEAGTTSIEVGLVSVDDGAFVFGPFTVDLEVQTEDELAARLAR